MKEINFITGNESKFKEACEIIKNSNLDISLVMKDIKLVEIQNLSQEKVLLEKAKEAYKQLQKPVIVDDTGIYFEEFKDFPGTLTKFIFKSIGFSGVEKLLKDSNKKAYFKTMICYKDGENEKIFLGIWHGKIIDEISKKFNPDWEYNSIFVPEGYNQVLSEITLEERAKKSHRKKAFDELIKFLKTINKNGK